MQYIPNGTSIILWGTGYIGKQIIEGAYGNYDIVFAVDSKIKEGGKEQIGETDVYPLSRLDNVSGSDILLVIGFVAWREAAGKLKEKGWHIFDDYLPYIYLRYSTIDIGFMRFCMDMAERNRHLKKLSYGKKLCALYGYCHMTYYTQCLISSDEFLNQYCILELPHANSFLDDTEYLNDKWIYSVLDILLLATVYPEAQYHTPDWKKVKSWVKDGCKVIVVTVAGFKGYFPQSTVGVLQTYENICWGDKNLNCMIKEKCSVEEMIRMLSSEDFYNSDEVENNFETACEKLDVIEQKCDVKIGDYIRKYGRSEPLMYSSTHPTDKVMKEIASRIFRIIGIDSSILERIPQEKLISLKMHGEFIYPSVYRGLGMQFNERERVCVGDIDKEGITFAEFIRLYVQLCTPYLLA